MRLEKGGRGVTSDSPILSTLLEVPDSSHPLFLGIINVLQRLIINLCLGIIDACLEIINVNRTEMVCLAPTPIWESNNDDLNT